MRPLALSFVAGLATLPILIFLSGMLGLLPTRSTATPPGWEAAFARHALHATAAAHAGHLQNPVPPTDSNLRAGMKFFHNQCQGCHGSLERENVSGLYPPPPRLALHPPRMPDAQVFWIIKNGVRYSGMFALDGEVSDDKIWTVVTFLTHVDSLPPSIVADWKALRE